MRRERERKRRQRERQRGIGKDSAGGAATLAGREEARCSPLASAEDPAEQAR